MSSRGKFYSGIAMVAAWWLVASAGPGLADPAYTPQDLLAAFLKDKAAAEAARYGGGRHVCFQDDDDPGCATPQSHDLRLNFEFDSDRLASTAMKSLSQVAAILKDPQLRGVKFEIDGYTDATGSDTYNLSLSERRAASVVNFLVSNGVPRSALAAKGFGKTKPRVADPYSPENRRVETHLSLE